MTRRSQVRSETAREKSANFASFSCKCQMLLHPTVAGPSSRPRTGLVWALLTMEKCSVTASYSFRAYPDRRTSLPRSACTTPGRLPRSACRAYPDRRIFPPGSVAGESLPPLEGLLACSEAAREKSRISRSSLASAKSSHIQPLVKRPRGLASTHRSSLGALLPMEKCSVTISYSVGAYPDRRTDPPSPIGRAVALTQIGVLDAPPSLETAAGCDVPPRAVQG
jgi:hypothetical protein